MSRRLPVLICLLLVLAASMTHVAAGFGSLEQGTRGAAVGWLAASGIDAGIAVLMWRLMAGNAAGRRWAVAGIVLMSAVSAYANLDHALGVAAAEQLASTVLTAWHGSPWWQVARVLVLSVTLPALTIVLAAVAHSDAMPTAPTPVLAPARRARAARGANANAQPLTVVPDERLSLAVAHYVAHPLASDLAIADATDIPRSTVGRWRRAGLLDAPTKQEASNA
ncbi:MAG: hypothetical protein IT341_06910 [Chloroflexi bacterium]|nr:hypothetical protein [Chloroflexota bacterium]